MTEARQGASGAAVGADRWSMAPATNLAAPVASPPHAALKLGFDPAAIRPLRDAFEKALTALFLAVLMAFVSVAAVGLTPVRLLGDKGVDWQMRLNVGRAPPAGADVRLTLVEADDAACELWRMKDPAACDPNSASLRRMYAGLIRRSEASGARAVVLDADLSSPARPGRRGDVRGQQDSFAADEDLRAALRDARIPIFVLSSVRASRALGSALPTYRTAPSILDDIENPYVRRAHGVWEPDEDQVVRRPKSFIDAPRGYEPDRPAANPALGLAVAAWVRKETPSVLAQATRYPGAELGATEKRLIFALDDEIPWWVNQRIADYPQAYPISRFFPRGQVADSVFRGAVVFLGSSPSDAGTALETPLGRQSHVRVVMNHVYSLVHYKGVSKPPALAAILYKLMIGGLFTGLVFAYWLAINVLLKRWTPMRGALVRWTVIALLFALLILVTVLLICLWAIVFGGAAMQQGIGIEPWTPVVVVFIELTMEGVKALLSRLEAAAEAFTHIVFKDGGTKAPAGAAGED